MMDQTDLFEHAGLSCKIILTGMGHHCGYVAVGPDHPWFGKNYSDQVVVPDSILNRPISVETTGAITMLCASINSDLEAKRIAIELAIDVHGGLTFAAKDRNSDLWWFGFDCAHAGDGRQEGDEGWKDRTFVADHCRLLADQLQAVRQWTPTP